MKSSFVCFGEVLWDVFPDGERIGGAPLNVAQRLSSFNNQVTIISAVGNDSKGKQLLDYLNSKNLNTEFIQTSQNLPTSQVLVTLDSEKSASYDIVYPCAWDCIEYQSRLETVVKNSDYFVFGSLIARNSESKNTLLKLLKVANYKVLDINLRPPHYNLEELDVLMKHADFIKFNEEELEEISDYYGINTSSLETQLTAISNKTNTSTICVTMGENGAILLKNNILYKSKGYPAKVIDTVGAGDSFLATLLDQLQNSSPQKAINFASAMGALVTQHKGANPFIQTFEIENLIFKTNK